MITEKRFRELEVGRPPILDVDLIHFLKDRIDLGKIKCCFDIGANIGQTSKKFIDNFPNATIYAFEPIRVTYEQCIQNLSGLPRLRSFQEAMGSKPGEVTIYHRSQSEWNSLVKELNDDARTEGGTAEQVKVNSIDHFVKNMGITEIDILKSDTEGFELSVLEGGKEALSKSMIAMLYIEVGLTKGNKQHTYWIDIVSYLEKYNYHFYGLFESAYDYANALFVTPAWMLKYPHEIKK